MKKMKGFRRMVCVGLVLAMLAGLTACGKTPASGKNSSNPSLAKQFVYTYRDLEIPDVGDNMNIRSAVKMEDRIYLVIENYNWESNNETKIMIASMKEDGTDMQKIDLKKTSDQEADPAAEETQDNSGSGEEDSPAETEETEPGNTGDDIAAVEPRVEDSEIAMSRDTYEYTGYGNYAFGEDGRLYAVKTYSFEDYSDPDNYISRTDTYICAWDLTGNLLWERPVENLQKEGEYNNIRALLPAANGKVMIWVSGDSNYRIDMDTEGNISSKQELPNGSKLTEMSGDVVPKKDGKLLVIYYNDSWTEMYVAEYDIATDTLGTGIKLPDSMMRSGYNSLSLGVSTDLVYSNSSGLYSINAGDDKTVQLMSFVNSDMNTSSLNSVVMLSDTQFIAVYYDNMTGKARAAIFTKRNPEDIPDKKVLVLAGMYVDWELKNRVVEFNKESEEYRIVLKEYEEYSTMEDYQAGIRQLNNDIISGKMPDILVVDTNTPIENYISKGLIADVGELIEKDEELSKKEFLENVFTAYKVNGKLYQIMPSFSVRTLTGKTSKLEGRTSWNMQEFLDYAAALPEGTLMMSELTRDYFMYMMMQYCGNDFIDVSTGKCNFDSPEFIGMLEFAKTLPKELSEDYYEDYFNSYSSQYREDKTILMEHYFNGFRDVNTLLNGYFGEDVTYIGFPSQSGQGAILMGDNGYALSAKSENLDAAWQFIRYYLTDEYQSKLEWGMPVSKKIFEEKAKDALGRPYFLNEDGTKQEYDNYFDINGESIILDPLNQQQLDQLTSMITSVEKRMYYNEDIQKIISEEAEAFFEGQKSAAEVVQIIQSRAQIFVDENR